MSLSCSEADRLEEVETAEAAGELAGDDVHGLDMRANAVCVINAQGIIQMANKVGRRLWAQLYA